MNLTINDVRRKQFDKAFRGYDPTEVDLFLKQVADRLEAVQDEARRADDRVREMEAKLAHYEKVELALQEALESARETARRSEAAAEEKARLMIQEAELRAEKILHDAERERHGLRQDLVRLNARQAEVGARLRGFLLSELEVLAQFQGDDPVGFLKLQPAGPAGHFPRPPARLEAPTEEPQAALDEDARQDAADRAADRAAAAAEPAPPEPAPEPAPPEPVAPEPAPTAASDAPASDPPPAPADDWAEGPPGGDEAAPGVPAWEPPAIGPREAAAAPPQPPEPSGREPWLGAQGDLPGAYATADDPAAGPLPEGTDATPPPAVTGGWDLRSLVTGVDKGDPNVAGSEEERDRIRRILDDLE